MSEDVQDDSDMQMQAIAYDLSSLREAVRWLANVRGDELSHYNTREPISIRDWLECKDGYFEVPEGPFKRHAQTLLDVIKGDG